MTKESLNRNNGVSWYVCAIALAAVLLVAVSWGVGLMEGYVWAEKPEEAVSEDAPESIPSGSQSREPADTTEGDVRGEKPEEAPSAGPSTTLPSGSQSEEQADTAAPELTKRLDSWEKLLLEIRVLLVKAEDRTYDVKLMARQLVRIMRVMVILLFVIAFAVPISIWFLGRGALLGMPSDVASTLIAIEERQAKLVNIFKEMQDEMEELQSMSGPDLKKLLSQAAEYMKQNEKALKTTGVSTRSKGL